MTTPDFGVSKEDTDKLYNDYESGSLDGKPAVMDDPTEVDGMEAAVNDEAPVETAPVVENKNIKAEAPPELQYEFVHNGKMIKAPLSQILQHAQKGYDYAQKMEALNKERQDLERLKDYEPIDEWVTANPDKWERLQAVIKAEQQGLVDLPPEIAQKLSKYDQFIEKLETEQRLKTEELENKELDAEIQSIREKYKDLDWTTPDSNGRTREDAVIAHAVEHGIKKFAIAFKDLYHDDLLKIQETKTLERYNAQKEAEKKKGLLPVNKGAPVKLKAPEMKTNKYEDTDSILAELGLGQ